MKIRDVMTDTVIRINPEESVAVAARTLHQYNIGALLVCGGDGRMCGLVTDRDLVVRCLASGRNPEYTPVKQIMTRNVISAQPDMDTGEAAQIMGQQQIRRLPVMENGKLCGMISLGDLANHVQTTTEAGGALRKISNHLSQRD